MTWYSAIGRAPFPATNSSTSYGLVSGASAPITLSARASVFISATGLSTVQDQTSFTGTAQQCVYALTIDGTVVQSTRTAPAFSGGTAAVTPGIAVPFSLQWVTSLTAGNHVVSLEMAVGPGTQLGSCGASNSHLFVAVQ